MSEPKHDFYLNETAQMLTDMLGTVQEAIYHARRRDRDDLNGALASIDADITVCRRMVERSYRAEIDAMKKKLETQ